MIKGLVFDLDGLLLDSERIVQRSWNASGADLGYPDIGSNIYHTIGFNRARRKVYFKGIYGDDFPFERFQSKASDYFQKIVEEEGVPLKEGAREILTFAKQRGLKVGLATSSSLGYAENSLKETGLYEFFDGIVGGNMVSRSKPDPQIYQKACDAIGLPPPDCGALEDSPSGISSAWAAGLRPIMVPDLVQPDEETLSKVWMVKDSLSAVTEALRKLLV